MSRINEIESGRRTHNKAILWIPKGTYVIVKALQISFFEKNRTLKIVSYFMINNNDVTLLTKEKALHPLSEIACIS